MGLATEDVDHDNTRMIARTACTIGLFGGMVEGDFDDPPFSAFASGPTSISHDNSSVFEYSSYYQGCLDGIVTYHWEISWDYGNTFQHLSFGEDAVLGAIDVPEHAPVGYIRLTAMCSEEPDTYVDFLEVKNWTANYAEIIPGMINVREEGRSDGKQEKTRGISLQSSQNTFSAFPNPVRDILQIRKHSRSENQVYVFLVSAQGVPFFYILVKTTKCLIHLI